MCGICGVYAPENQAEILLERGMAKILHRGPNGRGTFIKHNLALGHQRLSIIDLTGGKQPFSNPEGDLQLVFNGCIYNYLELRQKLSQAGHTFATFSDTEVIIHAYEEYGEDCLKEFIGVFSFILYDQKQNQLFAARDRLGAKPFYYCRQGERLLIASEIKALLAMDPSQRKLDKAALSDYLAFQIVLKDRTLFSGIKKLQPGHCLTFNLNSRELKIRQYWDLNFEVDFSPSEEYFVDLLRGLSEDAVKICLRSDVPLGVSLSGGLDSSAINALAAYLLPRQQVSCFTGYFAEGPEYDETPYAELAAQSAGTKLHKLLITENDFIEHFKDIIYCMDEPAAGPGVFPQYMVSRLAGEHVRVIIGGQGGDEIFLGYARYLVAYLEECLKGAMTETYDREKHIASMQNLIPNLPLLKNYQPMLQYFWAQGLFGPQEERYFRLMDRSQGMKELLNPELPDPDYSPFETFKDIFLGSKGASMVNRMMYFDVKEHLPALLQVDDRVSMRWALESRAPFLDHRLVELMGAIPPLIKFHGGELKYLMKQVIRSFLPREILERKDKMGFPVPFSRWKNGKFGEFAREILLGREAREAGLLNLKAVETMLDKGDYGRPFWGALCLQTWFNLFEPEA